jgi:hypothetical protein
VGKHCSNPQRFKEKNYKLNFQPTILKKIWKKEEDNFEKKKAKKMEKKHVGKIKAEFSTSSIF